MGIDVSIRKAVLADMDDLTDLCMRSKQSNGYDDAFMSQCVDELRVRESWVLNDDFWVAETEESRIVGCIRLSVDAADGTGELETCFVEPGWKGRKIGRMLADKLLEKAVAARLGRIGLDADPFAEAFYEKLGFREVGRVQSGSISGRTLARMELDLTPVVSEAGPGEGA